MQDPEMRKPQEVPNASADEGVHGVMLDPDSIRALLAKLREKTPEE